MDSVKTKVSYVALAALMTAPIFGAAACGDDINDYESPGGLGGNYNAGDGGPANAASSSGTGMSSGSGEVDAGPPPPPMCVDSLKRCPHEFTLADTGQTSVELRGDFGEGTWAVGVPMVKQNGVWAATTEIPYGKAVAYKFFVDGGNWIPDPANPNTVDDGQGGKNSLLAAETCDPWTCDAAPVTSEVEAWKDEVLYFVFVDRFLDGNPANNGSPTPGVPAAADYKGGDWQGVINKVKEGYFGKLGVTALWLTVPMNNTEVSGVGSDGRNYSAYHGYWPKDFDKVEEHFGDMAKLKELVTEAHAANLKVLYDYAANHSHDTSPVYQMHKDWYWPNDNGNGGNCVCGSGCSWDPPTAEKCWFTPYLPDFNYENPAARKFSVDNAIWWFQQTGIDGYRLDALKHMSISWLTDLRARVKAEIEPNIGNKHFYMVGETYTGDKGLIKKYVDPNTMLDGQFDFPLRADVCDKVLMRHGSMQDLEGSMNANDGYYGNGIMSTFLGNHDLPRIIHLAQTGSFLSDPWNGGKDNDINWTNTPGLPAEQAAFERVANGFTVLLTTQGIPLIYYGDEIGLPGAGDPDNRRPMQWAGYSAGQLLLRGHIEKLGQIRKDHVALRRGKRSGLWASTDTMAYKMVSAAPQAVETVYVAINRGDGQGSVGNLPNGTFTDLVSGQSITVSGGNLNVPARKSIVFAQ